MTPLSANVMCVLQEEGCQDVSVPLHHAWSRLWCRRRNWHPTGNRHCSREPLLCINTLEILLTKAKRPCRTTPSPPSNPRPSQKASLPFMAPYVPPSQTSCPISNTPTTGLRLPPARRRPRSRLSRDDHSLGIGAGHPALLHLPRRRRPHHLSLFRAIYRSTGMGSVQQTSHDPDAAAECRQVHQGCQGRHREAAVTG